MNIRGFLPFLKYRARFTSLPENDKLMEWSALSANEMSMTHCLGRLLYSITLLKLSLG